MKQLEGSSSGIVVFLNSVKLDEFKREMWLLLVAAGSGYIARCWQNALKTRPALTELAHVSSSPETPINSGYGSPNSSRERSSSNSEDAHGSRQSQECRRQQSFALQITGLGTELSHDATEDTFGDPSGTMKEDSDEGRHHAADQDSLSRNISSGSQDPYLGCLGCDATCFEWQPDREKKHKHGLMPRKIKAPSKLGRGRGSIPGTGWMRESPKSASSLDSCLRAQLVGDCAEIDGFSLPCALEFPAITAREMAVAAEDALEQKVKKTNLTTLQVSEERHLTPLVQGHDGKQGSDSGIVGRELCQNSACLRRMSGIVALEGNGQATCILCEGISKNVHLPLTVKKRKLLAKGQSPPSPDHTDKDIVGLRMDGLLFCFGVGVGMMSMINTSKDEMERIDFQLREAEDYMECLKQELDLKKVSYSHTNFSDVEECLEGDFPNLPSTVVKESNFSVDNGQEPCESARSEDTVGIMESGIQMAQLEAELEAELQLMEQNLTGETSSSHKRQFSGLSDLDLDGLADVIEGDLKTNGLPRPLDPDDDQIDSVHEDTHPSNWAVSPRDLDRRLQKLVIARQEESIAELESKLQAAESEVILKENEIQWWKDRFQKVTDLARLPSKSGMHKQPSKGNKRKPMGTSKAMSESAPLAENHARVWSTLLDEAIVSEAANDHVFDEFLKAVKESGTITENENLGAGDALLLVHDGMLVNSLGATDYPVTAVADCNNSAADVDRCYDDGNTSSISVQPEQADDLGDTASTSVNRLEREMRKGTWGIKKSYARPFGGKDDLGLDFHASRIGTDNGWGSRKSSARLPSDGHAYGGARTTAEEPAMSSVITDDNSGYGHGPTSSSAGVGGESVERFAASLGDVSQEGNYMNSCAMSCAGANTPVDMLLVQQSVSSAEDILEPAKGFVPSETGTSVMDKIRQWEGVAKEDSPRADVGVGKLLDWEAWSWASDSELVHPVSEDDSLCSENQVESTLGEIIIKRVVEQTRRGSDIVREAQTVLATDCAP